MKRYLVILADRQRGRFFTIYMGSFEDQGEQIFDNVPQKVKAEGFRVAKIGRHIRDHLRRHLKHVGTEALNYLIKKKVQQLDGVIIGSHKELLSFLKASLPPQLKNKVIAEIVTEIDIPVGNLTNKIVNNLLLS